MIIDGLEKDRLHIYVGRDSVGMGVAIRVAPKYAIGVVQKQMKKLMPGQ